MLHPAMRPPMVESRPRIDGDEDEDDEEDEDEVESQKEEVALQHMVFRQIAANDRNICGILEDMSLICWGLRFDFPKPLLQPITKPGPFRQVAAGNLGICAILEESGEVECIGTAMHFMPANSKENWDQIYIGTATVCGVNEFSKAKCFGTTSVNIVPEDLDIA